MRTFSSLALLGAVGALSVAASSALAAVDTSQWKCESCPFEKAGTSGSVEAGVGVVSDKASKFGDYTGLNKNGAHGVLGGTARYRAEGGIFGSVNASDLGLDSRSLAAELGQEGLYTLRLGYAEIPRWFTTGARTPFLGNGSGQLTLPPSFVRSGSTAGMSLATDLQAVELGFKAKRLDLGASLDMGEGWTHRIDVRRDERNGTRRGAGAFFASSSQLALPVDHVTDQVEISTSYRSRLWQATLAYHASLFRNGENALNWSNPFDPSATSSGRLALAPANQFHQIVASGSYQISPAARASAEVAVGRMTQDEAYLAATTNSRSPCPRCRRSLCKAVPIR